MNGGSRNSYPDSSMSIPCYDGSMVSLRSPSHRPQTGQSFMRYKSGLTQGPPRPTVINWRSGKLDRRYECNFCTTHLKYPVRFQECGHRVCSSCLTDLLKMNPICPTCGTQVRRDKVITDNEFQREIQEQGVLCSNKQFGCRWDGILKSLNLHYEDCEYTMVECIRGCGMRYQRRHEREHIATDCLKNELGCDFCGDSITKAEEQSHLSVCRKFPLPCPSNCGERKINREDLEHHLEFMCNVHEIPCPFSDCSCEYKSLRDDMPRHLKESPGIHLNLMGKTLSLQKKQMGLLTELVDKQKEEIVHLTHKVDALEKFYGSQLIWRIDNYAEKFNDAKAGKKITLFSPQFLTSRHGYKLALSTALYGDGKAKGKFMSMFICICKGEFDALLTWPFSHKVTFTLLDQNENVLERRHISYAIKPNTCKENKPFLGRPTGDRNASFGAQKFIELDIVNSFEYIRDNVIYIKVEIDSEEMDLV